MESMSSNKWQRMGSSLIFDNQSLTPFLTTKAVISLRQFFEWSQTKPRQIPVSGQTLVVGGLQAVLETLKPETGEDFLRMRLRPTLLQLQSDLPNCGIVFAWSAPLRAFQEGSNRDEVLFTNSVQNTLRLSASLWGGGADVLRLIKESNNTKEETIGYYVSRIS